LRVIAAIVVTSGAGVASPAPALRAQSAELAHAIAPTTGSPGERPERVAGSIPEGRETVLDRVVHLEAGLLTEVPTAPRWCDRLELAGRRFDSGGAMLHVEEEGEGPALVLIHGGPGGTHHYFHPWFSRAAEFARIIYYDQRGCGLSDFVPGPRGYSVEQAVEDLEGLREALGLEKWVLLGYSYGGFLAQLYTIRHPERVAGLVLLSALHGLSMDLGSRQEEFISPQEQARKDEILEELRERRKENGWSSRETLQLLLYNWGLNGDWKRQHFFKPTSERFAQASLYEWDHDGDFNSIVSSSQERFDLSGAFEHNPIPSLVLEGEWDLTWGEKKRDALAGNHPQARYLLFENAGHNLYEEQPEAFFQVLAEFLGALHPVPPAAITVYQDELRRWQASNEATP